MADPKIKTLNLPPLPCRDDCAYSEHIEKLVEKYNETQMQLFQIESKNKFTEDLVTEFITKMDNVEESNKQIIELMNQLKLDGKDERHQFEKEILERMTDLEKAVEVHEARPQSFESFLQKFGKNAMFNMFKVIVYLLIAMAGLERIVEIIAK